MLFALAIPIGLTVGGATWALMRGRGRTIGLLVSLFFGVIGAVVGGLAVGAMTLQASGAALAAGTVAGAVLAGLVQGFGFGMQPKRVDHVDPAGVATERPDDGHAPRSVV